MEGWGESRRRKRVGSEGEAGGWPNNRAALNTGVCRNIGVGYGARVGGNGIEGMITFVSYLTLGRAG